MADEQDNDQEKTEDPTQQRIDDFRKKGDVAFSKELTSVLLLTACFIVLTLSSVFIFETLTNFMSWVYKIDVYSAYTAKSFKTIITHSAFVMLKCLAPLLLTVLSVGIIANLIQVGFLYSPDILTLKFDRLDPVAGMKKLISMKSLVEAFKGILKFVFVSTIIYFFMKDKMSSFQGFFHTDVLTSFSVAKSFISQLSFTIVSSLLIIALGDYAYQKFSYQKKLMMTKEESKREHKESEGAPEIKQKVKAMQREMAQQRMMEDVKTADVIVTNPTHLSVALKYDSLNMIAPAVVAKGADHLALRIRTLAKENNIPIVENVPLARGLYKTVKTGEGVPRGLYKAVAEILAFVYKLKTKQKAVS